MSQLPPLFIERLRKIVPQDYFSEVVKTFSLARPLSVRVNSLKMSQPLNFPLPIPPHEGEGMLRNNPPHEGEARWGERIQFERVVWCNEAFVVKNISVRELSEHPLVKEGALYIQSLSSMLPVLVLNPQPGEKILDLCAAPGSKATQIAAAMQDRGTLVCVEPVRERFYKLKSVLSRCGVTIARLHRLDGRRYQGEVARQDPGLPRRRQGSPRRGSAPQPFDRILVDAPCSSEGRFKTFDKKTFAYWSLRKIKEMVRKQRGLLLNAARLLKPGGVLVYSTCTFGPEENEGVVDWLLKKTASALALAAVDIKEVARYPAVTQWEGKNFSPQVAKCFRVLPTETVEGFFVAKIIRR